MDNQRIFKKLRILSVPFVAFMAGFVILASSTPALGQKENKKNSVDKRMQFLSVPVLLIDIRPGEYKDRAPSLLAFSDALSLYGELKQESSPKDKAMLANAPYSAMWKQGETLLNATAFAYANQDCKATLDVSKRAILAFAAAQAENTEITGSLVQAYLYRFLCAHKQGLFDQAMNAAGHLRTLHQGKRPKELSETTWQQYPKIDMNSNQRSVPVSLQSTPSSASLWIDFAPAGKTPDTLLLGEGEHILALHLDGRVASQEIVVKAKGTISVTLPAQSNEFSVLRQLNAKLQKAHTSISNQNRIPIMRDIMAAQEAEIAFLFHVSGQITVWGMANGSSKPIVIGQAPNAEIAGRIALEYLDESSQTTVPTMFPLYRYPGDDSSSKSIAAGNKRWWIYGAVLGAAVGATSFIVLKNLEQNTQRIEITLP